MSKPLHFHHHYTRDEARALLPQVRQWLEQLRRLRGQLKQSDEQLGPKIAAGHDLGGKSVHAWVRTLAELRGVLAGFQAREIQVKDLERGLIDFPALRGGKEVFLCWEQDEPDIEFWHELDAGYAGRERL
jgi:hypothetical protein